MIIILAESQGFNNSWDKPGFAKNWTVLLREHLSQFISNETGQRLSGHLEMGSSRTTICPVMLAQFQAHIWAQIPHCTYCVDLYLSLTLGGSQPCSGSEAVAVNEASSHSCSMSHLTVRELERATASQSTALLPPQAPSEPSHHCQLSCRRLGAALLSCCSGSSSEAALCLGLSHRDRTCSPVTNDICRVHGQLSRQGTGGWVYYAGLSRLLASFWGVWFVAYQMWSHWGPEVHRQVLQKALTHPLNLQQSSSSRRNVCKVWLPWQLAAGGGTRAALLQTACSGWFHLASGHNRAMQPHSGKHTWGKAARSEKEVWGTLLGTVRLQKERTRARISLLPIERPLGSRHFPAEARWLIFP